MSGEIAFFAGFGVGEIKTAVDDEHTAWRIGEPFRQIRRGDQGGVMSVGHDVSSMRAMAAPWPGYLVSLNKKKRAEARLSMH
jgi:hypothetical protein